MDDSLVKYINQIKQIPRLSPQEEKHLFKKIKEEGNEDAIMKIANNYLMLAVKMAFRYSNRCEGTILEITDLIDEGYRGLVRAAQKFDYEKCPIFFPYAVWWIRQKIMGTLYDHSKTIRISVSGTNKLNLYERIKNEAFQLEKEISLEEIADKIRTSTKKLKKTLRLIHETKTVSMDAPIEGIKDRWNTGVIGNFVSDEKIPCPEKILQTKQMKEKARKILSTVSPREEKILRMRFEDYELEKIGQLFGVCREQVRQSEARALRILRKKFTIKENEESFNFDEYL